MRFRRSLAISVLLLGALSLQGAFAQELSLDPNSLDTSGGANSASEKPARKKAARPSAAGPSAKADDKSKAENRQFGELEGWSPGKAPPKPKKDEAPTGKFGGSAPVSVTPSGGMSVGMPF